MLTDIVHFWEYTKKIQMDFKNADRKKIDCKKA